ncbi:MAG TPA: response regulator [Candidatus Kapabacteria bacterium]|nr:response regulator [Candidatus Kapabacteria bacterium]
MPPKILIIDDEDDIRENISRIFELSDYQVYTANNGKQGLVEARKTIPDIIICDIMMPEMDGISFLNFLKKEPEISSIPVVFLTARANESERKEGMKYGADIFISKPFDIDDLLTTVGNRIQRRKQNVKIYEDKINILQANLSRTLPHEIRTPMNAILGYSDFLIKNQNMIDGNDKLDIYKEINSSAKRLQRILDNFLTYANLNNYLSSQEETLKYRRMKIEFINFSIEEMIKLKLYEHNRIEDLEIELEDANAYISEIYLSKLIDEIIDNSIKFSQPGDKISIASFSTLDFYNLVITDNGIGMTGEQIKMLDAYIQFDRKKNEQQGAGLGIAIVKKITELFNGKFEIHSKKDEFTRVTISLKRAESK